MAHASLAPAQILKVSKPRSEAMGSEPLWTSRWSVFLLTFASGCITAGILWDISWHISIGRDTFWTPAHMMIYLGGSLGGFWSGILALDATFIHREHRRDSTIGIFGARAPTGAWVAMWGAGAMLTSAPFDNWWHDTYGLDVKILSPPHMVLALGMYGVVTGAVLIAASDRNQKRDRTNATTTHWPMIVANGIQVALTSILLTELSEPNHQHSALFYFASAIFYPAFLMNAARNHSNRWSATLVALVYMGILLAMIWLLPLFHAEPKLAPVYNRVDHMVPPAFPLLLVIPALGLDLMMRLLVNRTHWAWNIVRILLGGILFTALFCPTQWFFSEFLISPLADNWFFAGHGRFFAYMNHRDHWQEKFWVNPETIMTWSKLVRCWLLATASTAVGLGAGTFLAKIRR